MQLRTVHGIEPTEDEALLGTFQSPDLPGQPSSGNLACRGLARARVIGRIGPQYVCQLGPRLSEPLVQQSVCGGHMELLRLRLTRSGLGIDVIEPHP
ncbi:hypothetical protein ACFY0R_02010 [Streptomyces sp. NPDC001633]|uniref:hypothetical protein n=1 Tax=Streptomyces sp. NPDC001633 TaxID=3364595 RepID=UPI0036CE8B85